MKKIFSADVHELGHEKIKIKMIRKWGKFQSESIGVSWGQLRSIGVNQELSGTFGVNWGQSGWCFCDYNISSGPFETGIETSLRE